MSTKILWFLAGMFYARRVSPIVNDVVWKTMVKIRDDLADKADERDAAKEKEDISHEHV